MRGTVVGINVGPAHLEAAGGHKRRGV